MPYPTPARTEFVPFITSPGPSNLQDFGEELPPSSIERIQRQQHDLAEITSPEFNLSLSELACPPITRRSPRQIGIRVQFLTTRRAVAGSHDNEQMMVTGSLDELTSWGSGVAMEKGNGAWQYDLVLTGEMASTQVIEFLYKYTSVRVGTTTPVWESRISRCRLQLDKLLDHIFSDKMVRDPVDDPMNKCKIVFQANGIPSCGQGIELYLAGSLPSLGDWDIKQAKELRKAPFGSFHTTIFVETGTSFLYSYFLIRNASALFISGATTFPVRENCNAAMLWSSGVGRMLPVAGLQAVVQLLDEWDQSSVLIQDQPPRPLSCKAKQAPSVNKEGEEVIKEDTETKRIADSVEELNRRLHCKVCWEEDVQMVLVPCGHSGTCWRCGVLVNRCPICRSPITQRVRMFI